MKKITAILLSLTIILSAVSVTSSASDETLPDSTAVTAEADGFFDKLINSLERIYETICQSFDNVFGACDKSVNLNLKNAKKENVPIGTWWWYTDDITNGNCDRYLDFLKKNNVSEIYLFGEAMGYNVPFDTIRGFIKKCSSMDIRVAYLGGEYYWLDDYASYDRIINTLLEYQSEATDDEKFYSIHLDLEPAQHPDYQENPQEIMQRFADFLINKARPSADNAGLLLEWDIHSFLETFTVTVNGEPKNLCELFFEVCDSINIMSYNEDTDRIIRMTKDEISYAKKHHTKVSLCVEVSEIPNRNETFHEEGKRVLVRRLSRVNRKIRKEMAEESYGYAIHYVDSWYALQNYPLWGSTNDYD